MICDHHSIEGYLQTLGDASIEFVRSIADRFYRASGLNFDQFLFKECTRGSCATLHKSVCYLRGHFVEICRLYFPCRNGNNIYVCLETELQLLSTIDESVC